MEIITRNANTMFSDMLWRFKTSGVKSDSRNGSVIMIDEPVLTQVQRPTERVLFFSARDANPIFHILEAVWILAGRNDVQFVKTFNSRIGAYSDDGEYFNAAYGHRSRVHFGIDQISEIIKLLRRDPNTRRAVVQLWNAADLVNQDSKDLACNTQLVFAVKNGALDMTTFNRSNDAWYGYAGANIVHMTIIQEFIARTLEIPVGRYFTVTNNLHLYTELYDASKFVDLPPDATDYDAYQHGVKPDLLMEPGDNWQTFLEDCEIFCDAPFSPANYRHDFFKHVAYPMAMVSKVRKEKSGNGRGWANKIAADDWRIATTEWIDRREGQFKLIG